jgi:hypothetical protein
MDNHDIEPRFPVTKTALCKTMKEWMDERMSELIIISILYF